MEANPGARDVVFDQSGRIFAMTTKSDAIGIFTFEQDRAIEWSLMQLTRPPEETECKRYPQAMTEACLQISNILSLVAKANEQLRIKNWNQAVTTYQNAEVNNAALPKGLTIHLKRLIAELLLVEGRDMARAGDEKGALATLRNARRYDPELISDPEGALKLLWRRLRDDKNQILADVKKGQGEWEAKRGDLEATIEYLKEAKDLNPGLFRDADVETEAKRLVARTFFERGTKTASEGKIEDAIRFFRESRSNDPKFWERRRSPELEAVGIAATSKIEKGQGLAQRGNIPEALQEFSEAQHLDVEFRISSVSWNYLCWFGSLYGYAAQVVDDACEKAVAVDPFNWGIRDSRGLARALVGRSKEAIEDFREFAEKSPSQTSRIRRQRWIEELEKGGDPFSTPEEIEALKREE